MKEIIVIVVIVATCATNFVLLLRQSKNPWLAAFYISVAIYFVYTVLQPLLGLPKISIWALVGMVIFNLTTGILFSLYKDQKKNEQAQIEQQTIE